jgi:hypothetical protein
VSGEWFFLFFLIKKETKKSSLGILIGQIGLRMLKEKNSAFSLKQLFFLRILQTFDTRFRIPRTIEKAITIGY